MQETKAPLEYVQDMTLYLIHFTPGFTSQEGAANATYRLGHYAVCTSGDETCYPGKIIWENIEHTFIFSRFHYNDTNDEHVVVVGDDDDDLLNDKRYILNIYGTDYDEKERLRPENVSDVDLTMHFVIEEKHESTVENDPSCVDGWRKHDSSSTKTNQDGWAISDYLTDSQKQPDPLLEENYILKQFTRLD